MKALTQSFVLNNGVKMPVFGLGTFKSPNNEETIEAVKTALEVGYRHIDSAAVYGNEEAVGEGIRQSGVPREEIFLVSKVWNTDQGYETTIAAFEASLKRFGTDYLDLYLIHWPKPQNKETWRALEKLYKEGKIKAIGVSNFKEHHLEEILADCEIKPMVNQVEYHPELVQPELHEYCEKHNIRLEAWAPLMRGKVFEMPEICKIGEKYGKTAAQIALRWNVQMGVVTIPKSVTPARIVSNAEIFDFELTQEEVDAITALNKDQRLGPDPDHITF